MRLLLVDDHPMIYDALKNILERLPGHTSTEFLPNLGDSLVRLAKAPPIDLVLLDLSLPGYTGISALQTMSAQFDALPIAILSATQDPEIIADCLEAGARGYLPKTMGSAAMLTAIERIAAGDVFIPAADLDVPASDPAAVVAVRFGLTPRQVDVLKIMVSAKSNREIAQALGLSVNTVAVHVAAILGAMQVKNRTEAVMVAGKFGLRG